MSASQFVRVDDRGMLVQTCKVVNNLEPIGEGWQRVDRLPPVHQTDRWTVKDGVLTEKQQIFLTATNGPVFVGEPLIIKADPKIPAGAMLSTREKSIILEEEVDAFIFRTTAPGIFVLRLFHCDYFAAPLTLRINPDE